MQLDRRSLFQKIATALGIAIIAPSLKAAAPLKLWYRIEKPWIEFDQGLGYSSGSTYVHEDALPAYLKDGWRVVGKPIGREDVHVS